MSMGLTQANCAKRMNVHPQFYYAVEKGRIGCPFPILQALVKELKLERKKIEAIYKEYWGCLIDLLFRT